MPPFSKSSFTLCPLLRSVEQSVFVSGEQLVYTILNIPELGEEIAFLGGLDESDVVAEGVAVMGGLPDFFLSFVDVESVSNHSSRVLEESDSFHLVHLDPFSRWFGFIRWEGTTLPMTPEGVSPSSRDLPPSRFVSLVL